MAASGYGCVRYTFCVVNTILWLAGCGLLGVGLWLRLSHGGHASLLPQHQQLSADTLLMLLGAAVALLAGCGSTGALCRNRCLLLTYFVAVLVVLVLQLLALALGLSFHARLAAVFRLELLDGLRSHYTRGSALANTWDSVQRRLFPVVVLSMQTCAARQLGCCGVDSYQDWYNIAAWPNDTTVPETCCLRTLPNSSGCGESGRPHLWHPRGCYHRILDWLHDQLLNLGLSALALLVLQLFGLVASMMLYCTIGYKRRHRPTYRPYDGATSS